VCCPLAARRPCPVLSQLAARCPFPVLGQLAAHRPLAAILVQSSLCTDRFLHSVPLLSSLRAVRSLPPLCCLLLGACLTLRHYSLLREPNSPSGGRTRETTQEPLETAQEPLKFLKNP